MTVDDQTLLGNHLTELVRARELLARIVRVIDLAKPCAIGLDIFLREPRPNDLATVALIAAIKEAKMPIAMGAADRPISMTLESKAYQNWLPKQMGKTTDFVNLRYEQSDKVVRTATTPGGIAGSIPKKRTRARSFSTWQPMNYQYPRRPPNRRRTYWRSREVKLC